MLRTWVALITIVILYPACQKESAVQNNNPTPPPPPPTVLDSNYIDTLYKTVTRGGITGTVLYFKYYYDASKRVTLVKWETNDFMQPVNGGGTETFFYNNNDNLPYKSVRNQSFSNGAQYDTITFFHSFDNNSRLIKDSALDHFRTTVSPGAYYFERTHIMNYQYNTNMVVKNEISIPTFDPSNNNTITITDSANISPSGNPVSSVEYVTTLKYFTMTISYDNNPNPHNKLNIFKTFPPVPSSTQPGFYTSFIGNNNFISYTIFSSLFPSYNGTSVFTNTYLPNGYLLKAVTPSTSTPGDIETWIYKYKAL